MFSISKFKMKATYIVKYDVLKTTFTLFLFISVINQLDAQKICFTISV